MVKLPKITPARMKKALEAAKREMEANERREQQRMSLTGPYAPPDFPCLVCHGTCHAHTREPAGPIVLGGPPSQLYVAYWECSDCGLRYGKQPSKDCERRT